MTTDSKGNIADTEPTALEDYQEFIDALVKRANDVSARWVREKRPWPDLPENRSVNEFVSKLSDEQRKILASLLDDAHRDGVHNVLAYLNDEIYLRGFRLVRNGREFPVEPFGTELYWDWICRCEGDPWPDEVTEDETS